MAENDITLKITMDTSEVDMALAKVENSITSWRRVMDKSFSGASESTEKFSKESGMQFAEVVKDLDEVSKTTFSLNKEWAQSMQSFGMNMLGVGFFMKMLSTEFKNLFQEQDNVLGISLKMAKAVGGDLFNSLNTATVGSQLFSMALLNDATPSIEKNVEVMAGLQKAYEDMPGWVRDAIGGIAGFVVVFGDLGSKIAFTILGLIAFSLAGAKILVDIANMSTHLKDLKLGFDIVKTAISGTLVNMIAWGLVIVAIGALAIGFYDIIQVYLGKKTPEELDVVGKAFFTLGLGIAGVFVFIENKIKKFGNTWQVTMASAALAFDKLLQKFGFDKQDNINALESRINNLLNERIDLDNVLENKRTQLQDEFNKMWGNNDSSMRLINEQGILPSTTNNNNTSVNIGAVYDYGSKDVNDLLSQYMSQANTTMQEQYGITQ